MIGADSASREVPHSMKTSISGCIPKAYIGAKFGAKLLRICHLRLLDRFVLKT